MSSRLLSHFAAFAAGPEPDRLAALHADDLRIHMIDTLAALSAGAASAIGRSLAGKADQPHLAVPRSHWADRAALAAAIIRSTDIDDIHTASCVTPSSAVLPVALALAGTAPERVPAAILAGAELMVRLAKACRGPEILYQGIWPTSLTASLGAAATAARMLGLDADRTAHALGGALSVAAGRMGPAPGKLPMRWLLFGQQVRLGCLAALSAARGEEADLSLLDGKWLEAVLGAKPDADLFGAPFGQTCALAESSIKTYCGAKMIAAGIEAFQKLLENGLDLATVDQIEITVPSLLVAILDRGVSEADSLSWFTSAPLQMALVAYRPEDLLKVDRSRIVLTEPMTALMEKVKVQADPSLDRIYPEYWPARVIAGPHEAFVRVAAGDPGRPLSPEQLRAKWRVLLGASPGWLDLDGTALVEALAAEQQAILGVMS